MSDIATPAATPVAPVATPVATPAAAPVVATPVAQPAATPAVAVTPSKPAQFSSHLDKFFKAPDPGVLSAEDASKPITRQDMVNHQKNVEQANMVRQFHDDMRKVVNGPTNFADDLGITHAYTSAEQVEDLARFTNRILTSGLSARQLV